MSENGKDLAERTDRVRSDMADRRPREMVRVLEKVEPRFASASIALVWYRSEPLPGFSDRTAAQLVRSGRTDEVLDYVEAMDAGIQA